MSKSIISDTSKNNNTNEINIKKINISIIEDIDKEIDLITNIANEINLDKDEKEINDKILIEFDKSKYKKWIKLIKFNETINFDKYDNKNDFIKVADIIIDNEKKRKTVIKFVPVISTNEFREKCEWIYIFTINNYIVKIGGTRDGLKGRVGSYLCGHHIQERGKSGDCSKTNAYIYNTFDFYLNIGYKINMYAYKIPEKIFEIIILGKKQNVKAQTYHAYETIYLENYKTKYKSYPQLSDNCDPNYKNDE